MLRHTAAGKVLLIACIIALTTAVTWAIVSDNGPVALLHSPAAVEHADQGALMALPQNERFPEAFEIGDDLFATAFNALDGGGANVGRGQRFSRIPRADLKGAKEWFNHAPIRVTGPNAQGCFECHEGPFEDGAGTAMSNVHRDPFRTGRIGEFIERNTPHLFAPGAIQRLAEEMTDALTADQNRLVSDTCRLGGTQTATLQAKGIGFGTLTATRVNTYPCQVAFNTDEVRGVDFQASVDNPAAAPQLIVRPFQWKGSVAFLRDFNRGAAHNELGMQAVEIVGDNVDGDYDGVTNELTIGDQTALAVYMAAQPRPTTLLELNELGLLEPALTLEQTSAITRGKQLFKQIGCASCHEPALPLLKPVFSEPSQNPAYRDGATFPAGQSTVASGVDPRSPITFDLTSDQPDNIIFNADGSVRDRLGSFTKKDASGRTVVELYGDLKRHVMGPKLAESVNEIAGDDATPIPLSPRNRHTPDTFLTENLWGVGSTAPYLHDGRATTLTEAILEHAMKADPVSEAGPARDAFVALSDTQKKYVIAFLDNLVLFKLEEQEASPSAASSLFSLLSTSATPRQVVKVAPKGFKIRLPQE